MSRVPKEPTSLPPIPSATPAADGLGVPAQRRAAGRQPQPQPKVADSFVAARSLGREAPALASIPKPESVLAPHGHGGDVQEQLGAAILRNEVGQIDALVRQGADINKAIGRTQAAAIFFAATLPAGRPLLDKLLDLGGDIDADHGAGTALHAAVTARNLLMLRDLTQLGADPFKSSRAGVSAYTLAQARRDESLLDAEIADHLDHLDRPV